VTPNSAPADDAVVSVVSLYAKQDKIYARAVSGWFAWWRWLAVVATQLAFYGLPWLEWNARQAVLLDLTARRFYIFGLVLYPQDFIYLTALLVIAAWSLFLFTTVAGRVWCGYACPQTVYTEIFMAIERWTEGDRMARLKRDRGPWTLSRLGRGSAKHLAWGALALWTGITFVGYFTPMRELVASLAAFALSPWQLFWVLFYATATYGNAGFLREQVCKYMCPYARFQSAMFDRDTWIISYDPARGEPRGTRSRKLDARAQGFGDCIDCGLCVQVCPTGIDIRKGLQYECIGCAACIDVCNGVMDKMNYPRGLIRYDTQNGLDGGWRTTRVLQSLWRSLLRPRVLVYTAILWLALALLATSLYQRAPFRADVVRDRATLARLVEGGDVENVYRVQLMNATEQTQRLRLHVDGLPGLRLVQADSVVTLPSTQARWLTLAVRLRADVAATLKPGAHPVHFQIEGLASAPEGQAVQLREATTFVVPR
jgi:cytochrome c oxidase accessory protein FixG